MGLIEDGDDVIPMFREPNNEERKAIQAAAEIVIMQMTELTTRRLDSLFGMLEVAKRSRCDVVMNPRVKNSYSPMLDTARGQACVQEGLVPEVTVRRLAHELAHHLMFWNRNLFGAKLQRQIDAINSHCDAAEEICKEVEDLVVSIPFGLQCNGKLAAPRGDGFIRVPKLLKTRVPSQSMPVHEWGEKVRDLAQQEKE